MDIEFIAGFSLITESNATRELLMGPFGLPLKADGPDGEYFHSEKIAGAKHFGVWPLHQAAEACFGTSEWPKDLPKPVTTIEFEVKSAEAVGAAEKELVEKGHKLIHGTRTEPWGQTVCRLFSAEGAIIGVSYAPWLHKA